MPYTLYRNTTGDPPGAGDIITESMPEVYNDVGLTNGVTYYYWCRAVNEHGASALSNRLAATPQAPGGGSQFSQEPTSWTLVSARNMVNANPQADETSGSGVVWGNNHNSVTSVTNQGTEPISPPTAYQYTFSGSLPQGGPSWQYCNQGLPSNRRKLWVGYTFKVLNWRGHAAGVVKQVWNSQPGDWTVIKLDGPYNSGPYRNRITCEHANAGIPSFNVQSGEGTGTHVNIQNNTWYTVECIEQRPTNAGGTGNIQLWVNGTRIINTNRTPWSHLPYTAMSLYPYLGGGDAPTGVTQTMLIGHFRLRMAA